MGWHRPDEDSRADYERDSRKSWSADQFPARFEEPPIESPAQIAWMCQHSTTNKGADLIEAYARSQIARASLDATLEKITSNQPRRFAVAKLIGVCEGLCKLGVLSEQMERHLRQHIAETLSAFGMNAANREERQAAE